ncbi:MAG: leucine-rich repeat protein [Butyrivibrio sp.]|nr:leucine-rich repeat protein [Butyrivibrio sp.]
MKKLISKLIGFVLVLSVMLNSVFSVALAAPMEAEDENGETIDVDQDDSVVIDEDSDNDLGGESATVDDSSSELSSEEQKSATDLSSEYDSEEVEEVGEEQLVRESLSPGEEFVLSGFYTYRVNEDGQTVTFVKLKQTQSQTIPSKVTYEGIEYTVVAIADNAFRRYDDSSYCLIELPETVTKIGAHALDGCTFAKIPGTLQEVGEYAFKGCSFNSTPNLSDSITAIPDGLFFGTNITSIDLPDDVVSIGDYAFGYCSRLKTIEFNRNLESVGKEAFYSCDSIEELELPEGLISIGEKAFSSCSNLASVELSGAIKTIGKEAFINTKLKTIDIPDSVTYIGTDAFYALESCYIPISLGLSTAAFLFSDGTDPCNIYLKKGTGSWGINNSYSPWKTASQYAELSIIIMDGINSIPDDAFKQCLCIKELTLSDDVKAIGNNAFSYCGISSITWGDGIKTIGNNAFSYCSSLESISIPETITHIGSNCFSNCSLFKVVLPDNAPNIGDDAFSDNRNLAIVGNLDSYSQEYAIAHSIPFIGIRVTPAKSELKVGEKVDVSIEMSIPSGFNYSSGLAQRYETYNGAAQVTGLNKKDDGIYESSIVGIKDGTVRYVISIFNKSNNMTMCDSYTVFNIIPDNDATFDITFCTTSNFTKSYKVGEEFGMLPEIPSKVENLKVYDPDGWYTKPNGGGTLVAPSTICEESLFELGLFLWANWKIHICTISYDLNGHGEPIENQNVESGSLVDSPIPFDDDYTFLGWYKDEECKLKWEQTDKAYVDTVLYAKWGGKEYTVTFDPNGGRVDAISKKVVFGSLYGDLPVPEREGYFFAGWMDSLDSGAIITSESVVNSAGDHTLYANWTNVKSTSITLDYNSIQLAVGHEKTIHAGVCPENADKGVAWTTSNSNIVQVYQGTIMAMSPGKAIITATTSDMLNTASCDVTVVQTDVSNDEVINETFDVPDGLWTVGLEDSYIFTGSKITPEPRVYFEGTLLRKGSEYTISYRNNKNVGVATVTITGKGNINGKCTKNFRIIPLELQLEDVDIVAGTPNSGKAIKPTVVVKHNNIQLKENKDYKLSYEPIYGVGETDVTITGIGNYEGTVNHLFTVRAKGTPSLKKASIVGLKKTYSMTEMASFMADYSSLKVKLGKNELDSLDYKLRFEGCDRVGKGVIVIQPTDTGIYVGEKRVAVTITGTKLGSVILSQGVTFNGKTQIPEVKVYTGKKGRGTLLEEHCYDVSYSVNPINAGTVTVTVTGISKEGYSGKISVKYKIAPLSIDDEGITVIVPDEIYYTQGGVTPMPLINFTNGENTWTLREGKDYTIKYTNNKAVGGTKVPKFTITGKGNFSGKRAAQEFDIAKRPIKTLAISCADITANPKKKGAYYHSKPVIFDVNGKLLKENTDFTVNYTNLTTGKAIGKSEVVPVGTEICASIFAKEKNYTGRTEIVYKIVAGARTLSSVKVGKIPNQFFTGKLIELNELPLSYVTGSGKNKVVTPLKIGDDYVITAYYNNVKKGTASLRIEARGEYTGSKLVSFKIVAANALSIWHGNYREGMLVGFAPESVTLEDANVIIGTKLTMSPAYAPTDCDAPEVTWTSSNTKVATVDKNGVVYGKSKGVARITVTSKADRKLKGSATVTVDYPYVDAISISEKSVYVERGKPIKISGDWLLSAEIKQGKKIVHDYMNNSDRYVLTRRDDLDRTTYSGTTGSFQFTFDAPGTYEIVMNHCSSKREVEVLRNQGKAIGHVVTITPKKDSAKIYKCRVTVK